MSVLHVEVWHESCQTKIKVSAGLNSFLEFLGEDLFPCLSGVLTNSVPYRCGTGPISIFLLSAKGCSLLLEVTHIPWLVAPSSSFKASSMTTLTLPPWSYDYGTFSAFKDSCDDTGPTLIIQDNLPYFKVHYLDHICKIPFVMQGSRTGTGTALEDIIEPTTTLHVGFLISPWRHCSGAVSLSSNEPMASLKFANREDHELLHC